MKAVIMAGGKGTRVASVRNDVPKPMLEICGKPILQYQIENLARCGITEIILVVGYLGHVVQNYFSDGSRFGVNISYFSEETPLGTAGALYRIPELTEDFLLIFGDTVFDIDFAKFIQFHKEHSSWATLMAHPNGHIFDSSILVTKVEPPSADGELPVDTKRVVQWITKEEKRGLYKNRVNTGIAILSPEILEFIQKKTEEEGKVLADMLDLDRDILKPAVNTEKLYVYDTLEYMKDMGTPERFLETEQDIKSGLLRKKNARTKKKAVFVFRDGVLLGKNEKLLHEDIASAIRCLNFAGYLVVVLSPDNASKTREEVFHEMLILNKKLETELGNLGAYVDGVYSVAGGETNFYKMIQCAEDDMNINLSDSYLLTDSDFKTDIQTPLKQIQKISSCKDFTSFVNTILHVY